MNLRFQRSCAAALVHESNVRRRASGIKGYDVFETGNAGNFLRRNNTGGGSGKESSYRKSGGGFNTAYITIGLCNMQRCTQSRLLQAFLEAHCKALHQWTKECIHDSGRQALKFPEFRRHLTG